MISQIQIKNFKSIVDLTIDLGRVNLFIGENGSGKSNILEAVGFTSYASNHTGIENKIDFFTNAVLSSKGIRIPTANLLASAFDDISRDMSFSYMINQSRLTLLYEYYNVDFETVEEEGWREITNTESYFGLSKLSQKYNQYLESGGFEIKEQPQAITKFLLSIIKQNTPEDIKNEIIREGKKLDDYFLYRYGHLLTKYMIFSPENSSLRKFEEEGQIKPLGFRGEGLFSLLKSMASENGTLQHLKEHLELIDWFEDFSIPNDLMSNEFRISIKDRFINSDLGYFDQRSANEGFLFLLFYVVLFSSKRTPQFFAIDNIEASFNPKLCARLINMLAGLAKQNEKQVLMTTHNPATLDGLDLNDDEQRLFVVRRNIDGHTIVTRIKEKPILSTPMKLSEMWTKGLLGGLPDNF